jgi:hypothetical protein
MGQFAASAPRASWLAKACPLAAASASCRWANAVMLLSVSIVKVALACLLGAALGGHDIDHSYPLEKQANLKKIRLRRRRAGDGAAGVLACVSPK